MRLAELLCDFRLETNGTTACGSQRNGHPEISATGRPRQTVCSPQTRPDGQRAPSSITGGDQPSVKHAAAVRVTLQTSPGGGSLIATTHNARWIANGSERKMLAPL